MFINSNGASLYSNILWKVAKKTVSAMLSLVILSLACATCGAQIVDIGKCSSENSSNFVLIVNSRKNGTGHRLFHVDTASEAHGGSDQPMWDVKISGNTCGGYQRVGLTAVLSGVRDATGPRGRPARPDYELFPGVGYYKLHTTGKTWPEAKKVCESEGTHLIILNSEAEANVVKTIHARKPTLQGTSYSNYYSVGFSDLITNGKYVTVLGQPLDSTGYTVWDAGQPQGGSEDCGLITGQGKYHDVECNLPLVFICEEEL